jgi:hypothetical protein
MGAFDRIVQNAAEKLYEDERLRSNLTDGEAKVVLDWASGWVADQVNAARDETAAKQIVQDELARVRQTTATLNALAKKPGALRLADAVAALEPAVQVQEEMSREQVLKLATELASAMWTLRAHSENQKKSKEDAR